MKFKVKNLEGTNLIAKEFAKLIKNTGVFICLYGDIGVGKTAFTRAFLKNVGVSQAVTSPSFVILNEYKGSHLPAYHFDLYRLENEGVKSVLQELIEYSKERIITLVEWANFGEYELPQVERVDLIISYNFDEGECARIFEFKSESKKYFDILNALDEKLKKELK